MVLVQYKKNQKNSFIIEISSTATVNKVIQALLQIHNLRIYLERLSKTLQELSIKGVLLPPELQGLSFEDMEKHPQQIKNLDQQKIQYTKKPIVEAPYRYVIDKNHYRYGVVLPTQMVQILTVAINKAKKELQPKNSVTKKQDLLNVIDEIREAVMLTYPGYYGLPSWQPVVLILQDKIDYELLSTEQFEYFNQAANLWWAGKQLDKNKPLSQYSGKNEKTKITVKLQNPGGQQPPRQPPIDTDTYRKMIQYYHKKTEQNKNFDKDSINTLYQKSEWANQNLKQQLTLGKKNINYKLF